LNTALGEQPTRLQVLWGKNPLPSIARFGWLVYPGHGEVTIKLRNNRTKRPKLFWGGATEWKG